MDSTLEVSLTKLCENNIQACDECALEMHLSDLRYACGRCCSRRLGCILTVRPTADELVAAGCCG